VRIRNPYLAAGNGDELVFNGMHVGKALR